MEVGVEEVTAAAAAVVEEVVAERVEVHCIPGSAEGRDIHQLRCCVIGPL